VRDVREGLADSPVQDAMLCYLLRAAIPYNETAIRFLWNEDASVRSLGRTRLVWLCVFLVGGCVTNRQPVTCGCTAPGADVVFVADGSGDYRTTSRALGQAVSDCGFPLRVETVVWSHGYGRMLADHFDHCNHLLEGRLLAGQIAAWKQSCPSRAVFLAAHSSGAAVVLAAAENSPPDSLERIVLLAPAVACDYDLRPALIACRKGIDVFISRRDIGALGVGTGIAGTADRRWSAAAGRVGFAPILTCPGDELLYTKLRLHPWDCSVDWTGNHGSHYGTLEQEFMRAYVLPLLARCRP
jgi:pimeloyl-ACP methyl ester carboxylesterase